MFMKPLSTCVDIQPLSWEQTGWGHLSDEMLRQTWGEGSDVKNGQQPACNLQQRGFTRQHAQVVFLHSCLPIWKEMICISPAMILRIENFFAWFQWQLSDCSFLQDQHPSWWSSQLNSAIQNNHCCHFVGLCISFVVGHFFSEDFFC